LPILDEKKGLHMQTLGLFVLLFTQ